MRRVLPVVAVLAAGVACGPPPIPDTCKGRSAGDLVITEFLNDPDGTDTGSEWIEIFNTLGTSIDLKGVSIYASKLDGSSLNTHVIKTGTIAPRSYFVLGDVRSGTLPPYINYTYEAGLGVLDRTDAIIGLKCGTTLKFDEVQYRVAPKAAHARQLDGRQSPDAVVNDDETKWCDAPDMLAGTTNFGSPGQPNPSCPVVVPSGNCIDPGGTATRPVRPPAPGQVFITEVMSNPSAVGDTEGEWVELHSNGDVDLNDVVFSVGTSNKTLTSTQCLSIPAGGYAVLAHETDAGINGGLPNVLATFSAALGNTGGTLRLSVIDADAGIDIDVANYPSALNGVAWQLDPTRLDGVSNDDVGAYCAANVRYGDPDAGDFGTPAAANTMCGMTGNPSTCMDTGTLALRPIVPPAPGALYFTEVMADPRLAADNVGEWLELKSDNAVDLNGLILTVGTSARALSSPNCLAVPAGGYALLGHGTGDGGLPALTATFSQTLANTGGALTLSLPDAGVIDTTAYPAAVAGVAWQLSPMMLSSTGNDDPMNYCRATRGYPADGGDLGTPGDVNTVCPAPPNANECVDPGTNMTRLIVKPVLGDLAITELMADPNAVSDTTGEYIEVLANASFDLNGLTLANEGTGMSSVSSQACLPVTAGTYSLFARSLDPMANGGLPQPIATFSFALANSAATGPRQVVVRSGTTTLDTWSYTTSTSGASWQLKPGLTSPDDNEDAGSTCITPTMRITLPDGGPGDRGTPGVVNESCP